MKERYNIKRNDLCPCGSGKKYKYCCEGKVDWNQIIKEGKERTPYFSIRGRNLLFINKIAEALQLDSVISPKSLEEYRAAFTPEAVRKIHEALIDIWPLNTDIHSVLQGARSDVSLRYCSGAKIGLYFSLTLYGYTNGSTTIILFAYIECRINPLNIYSRR